MKKILTIALSAALLLSLVACSNDTSNQSKPIGGDSAISDSPLDKDSNDSPTNNVEIPNPYIDCDTLADAAAATGFDITVPDSIDDYPERFIRAIVTNDSKVIEIIYEKDKENKIRIRKAPGSADISGDYSKYEQNNTVTVGELEVTMKGNNDIVNLATWTNNDYTYSLSISSGISSEAISDLIASIE